MFLIDDLRFAQKYPFLKLAKRIVKEEDFSLEEIPEAVIARAKLIVLNSLQSKKYRPQIVSSKDLLVDEILAFPTAKIFVSLINKDDAFFKFSNMVSKNIFSNLEKESNETLLLIAKELKINFIFLNQTKGFVQIPIEEFLSFNSKNGFFNLVNQKVEGGKILFSKNEFCRLISFFVEKKLRDSFPLNLKGAPKELKSIAKEIEVEMFANQKTKFGQVTFDTIKPEFFPPCIQKLYNEILAKKNLTHLERFSLATFLLSVGMPPKQVIHLFSYTPNFNEKTTSYQVMRLSGKGGTKYSAAGCSKMGEYKLRIPSCPCIANKRIKHPIQVYKNQFLSKKTISKKVFSQSK